MSYLVLARRWRPQSFDEVVGQRPVTQTLKNALAKDRIAHALLFAGPRGVGKTTTARILAKALNCERGRTPDPCNQCTSCKEIAEGRSIDCMEIDGASNRGIDEVRELREHVRYAPSRQKFKVIIIDEVHMLTEPAFNALLKTLEEPPPGVVFILATTDAHKIPSTILSRCQRHDFRKLGQGEIVERLREIARDERATVADGAMKAIARAAEGSLRDAQSLLDQVIAYSGAEVSENDVGAVLGLVEGEVLAQAAQAIIERDSGKALGLVESLSVRGYDLQRFCQEMLVHLRDLMVTKAIKDPAPLLQASRVPPDTIRSQAQAFTLADLETIFQVLSRAEFEMRRAPHPRFVLEMALVEATEARALQSLETLLQRLSALEERLLVGPGTATLAPPPLELSLFSAAPTASMAEKRPPLQDRPPAPRPPAQAPSPLPPSTSAPDPQEGWARIKQALEGKKRSLAALLEEAKGVQVESETLIVTLENGTSFARSTLDDAENRGLMAAAAAEAFGRPLKVEYRFQNRSIPSAVSGSTQITTGQGEPIQPSMPRPRETASPERSVAPSDQGSPRRHPLVQKAVELFGGEVIRVSEKEPGQDVIGERG
ncbi:MAG: DNA polymerase III subunit gamma/tau [candidate division NC10 bacterium]|nr:DNA polymerase III subunit gamma/tau [candidate division NC10 bacterium]